MQLAAAESVLTTDERKLGVALVDIGAGTTDLAIFEGGSLWHTSVVEMGGTIFTNEVAVNLRTPIPDAENTKRRKGCALASMVDEDEPIEVASLGGRDPRVIKRRFLSELLQPRAEELFHALWDEIRRALCCVVAAPCWMGCLRWQSRSLICRFVLGARSTSGDLRIM